MNIDFIIPSYHSEQLTTLCIKSFEKFKGNKNFRYFVVENSNDISYRNKILSLAKNIVWMQNPTHYINSEANAAAIEVALPLIEAEYIFICHNDVAACHKNWLDYLLKYVKDSDYGAAAYMSDNSRIKALHISGLLVRTEIARKVSMFPVYENGKQILDVGDSITQYCRINKLKYFCCKNTHNDHLVEELCKEPFKSLKNLSRSLNSDNEVIFLHLGRGAGKTFGTYHKGGRINLDQWINFINKNILDF